MFSFLQIAKCVENIASKTNLMKVSVSGFKFSTSSLSFSYIDKDSLWEKVCPSWFQNINILGEITDWINLASSLKQHNSPNKLS